MTNDLERFLGSVPDGACVLLAKAAGTRYRVDGALQLANKHGLRIYGGGATLSTSVVGPLEHNAHGHGRSQRAMIQVILGSNIEIWDLTIRGPDVLGKYRAPYEEEAGIRLSGVAGATIRNVQVSSVYGDGVSVYPFREMGTSSTPSPSRNIVISGLNASVIGRQGVAVTGADGVIVEDSHFDGIAHSVFDLEPLPSQIDKNITLIRNHVGAYQNTFLAGLGYGPKEDVYVGYNTVAVPIFIDFARGTHFTIEHNQGGGRAQHPFIIGTGDDLRVLSNVQWLARIRNCPPNCGYSAISLKIRHGQGMCNVFAMGNSFDGAIKLYDPSPQRPCQWRDGGGNVIGSPPPSPTS